MAIQSLTRDELLALLRCARARSERDWLLIVVAFWHGLRASEVIAISRDMIADGYLTCARLKGSLRTIQALVTHVDPLLNERQALIEYAVDKPWNQPLFDISRQQFWKLFQHYAELAGIAAHKRHPHVLKHSLAVLSINADMKIHEVRQRLGHKSLSSTGAYLQVSDEQASMALERALGV